MSRVGAARGSGSFETPLAKRRAANTRVLVGGAGHFGNRALRELRARHPRWRLVAADLDARALAPWLGLDVEVRQGDVVDVLEECRQDPPRWVVPAVPFHLAHEWILRRLSRPLKASRSELPKGLGVPNPILGPSGDLYVSLATFRCPEHCPEPAGTCTVTGEKRPIPLFRLLGRIRAPGNRVLGIRSYQLAPGVGGVRGQDLLRLLSEVQASPGSYILFTACRCHGVLSGLRVSEPAPAPRGCSTLTTRPGF